jgi:hypothetical protein
MLIRRHMNRFGLLASSVCLALACAQTRPSTSLGTETASARPVVQGLDHFFATSATPEPLYHVFRDSLGLPEVYPFRDYGDFASGLVSMGNTLFEVVKWAVPAGQVLPTEFKGLAFEPSARLPETLAGLRARGIAVQKPESVMYTNPAGERALGYVNIPLDGPGGLPPAMGSIFINDNLGSAGAVARRRAGADSLSRRGGGKLGVLAVQELVIAVPDRDAALAHWRKLLGSPSQERCGVITWPSGPAMRFVTAREAAIPEMVVRVRALADAVRFLSSKGILHREGDQVLIDPTFVGGLRIRLVE